MLSNLSYCGAGLEESDVQPKLGSKVRLYVFIQPVSPFELVGEVVRSEATSFAIAYQIESPELRQLVDDVAALVLA